MSDPELKTYTSPDSLELLQQLNALNAGKVVLALSGGLDSMALLELLYRAGGQSDIQIQAVYINHGISVNASAWGHFCLQQCQQRQIPFQQVTLQISAGTNLEERARNARYQALSGFITEPTHILVTAHHADDQLETLLLALKRGSGAAGMGGMATQRPFAGGMLYRPLLMYSRQQLEHYAVSNQLEWIEDESNADMHYDRNFIRHQILPLLKQRWPSITQTAGRSMANISALQQLTSEYVRADVQKCVSQQLLDLQALSLYPPLQQDLIIRHWLAETAGLNPSSQWLKILKQQVIAARPDASPLLQLADKQVRRFNQHLYIVSPKPVPVSQATYLWQQQRQWELPAGGGSLIFQTHKEPHMMPLSVADQQVSVVFGALNLPFKPAGAAMHKPLKQWFKLWQVPPWQRQAIPLLVVGQQLQLVLGFQSACSDAQADYWVKWQQPD